MTRLRQKPAFAAKDIRPPGRLGGTAVAAMLIVGLSVAGCGSSSKSSTTSTTAITKTAFLAKGNAICTKGSQKLNAAQKVFGNKKPSQTQLTSYVKTSFTPIIQGQIDGIRALGAPAGDGATVTKLLASAQKGLNTVKSHPALIAGGGPDPFANFRTLAHPYGLTACASR